MKILIDEELAEIAYYTISKVRDSYGTDVKNNLYSRCRDLYSLIYYSGTLSAISFAYAKATESVVKNAFKWFTGESPNPPVNGREKLGYGLYVASICYLLKKMGLDVKEGGVNEIINILTSTEGTARIVDEEVLKFAKWLKRFAEALLK